MALDPIGSAAPVVAGAVRAGLAPRRRDLGGLVFQVLLLGSLLITLAILFTLVADVVRRALPVFLERGPGFLGGSLSSDPAKAGVLQGIFGTLGLGVMVAILAFPVGIATAIYLEEYAGTGRFARFVQINIRNLAGVPSVVYGLLGLAIFVPLLGRNALSGGATLAVLVLPIVVITASEALRAVPVTLREAGYGVGASTWEVTSRRIANTRARRAFSSRFLDSSTSTPDACQSWLTESSTMSGWMATISRSFPASDRSSSGGNGSGAVGSKPT